MHTVYLALGSNLGDRLEHLAFARTALRSLAASGELAASAIFETAPVGGPKGQGWFLNQVVRIDTGHLPRALLEATQAIEAQRGRAVPGERVKDGPRPLDVDVLLWNDATIDEPGLCVPHPRMHERRFVLAPLSDLDPGAKIPTGAGARSARELLATFG